MYAYNPRKKSFQQLEKSLIGKDRWDILNSILKELSLKKGESPKQHWMVVGPRGIGKSHLLSLLYYKIANDDTLRNLWIPVLFPEEIRMAGNLAKFLERAVREICQDLEKTNDSLVIELKSKIDGIKKVPSNERTEYLFSILTWIHTTTGRYILLITENLQQLLGKRISVIEQKKLRAYLQTEDAVLLIGSATTVFDALHDHSHPFYHFFHISRLEDLSFDDLKSLVINLLTDGNQHELAKKVAANEARIRALYSFTGGNPRIAVFLADMLKAEMPDEMIAVMDKILDDMTPYFEAILSEVPHYQEEILNTLAAYEPAQSPKDIAAHLEVPQPTVRNYLKQLKENGYVKVAFSKGKYSYYCLKEYLYRIWYQMRDSSHREESRWLMELLLMLYSPSAIVEEKRRLEQCASTTNTNAFYNIMISNTASFIAENPDDYKVIEMCIAATEIGNNASRQRKELIETVLKFVDNEKYEEAIKICGETLKANPLEYSAYLAWGYCLRKQGKYAEAIDKFKEVTELKLNDYTAYRAWGDCLRALCRYEEAEQMYLKAIKINPKYEDAYLAWGQSLVNQKLYDDAIKKFIKASEINPKSEDCLWLWGECLIKQRRYEEAIDKLKEAIELKPNYYVAYEAWGDCLSALRRYEEAEQRYLKAIEINPKCGDAYVLWGQSLINQKLYDDAIKKFIKASEINPKSEDCLWLWGVCLRKQQRYEEAIGKFKEVLELKPDDYTAYGAWGDCLRDLCRYDEAEKKYLKTIEINPKYEDVYFAWGQSLMKQKRYDDAIALYKQLLKINRRSEDAYKAWAAALMESKEYNKAIRIYESQLAKSNDRMIIYKYGKALFELKRYQEALIQFQQLIDLHFGCLMVYLDYGYALEKTGKKEEALIAYLSDLHFGSNKPLINLNFQEIFNKYISPLIGVLKPDGYLKQFYTQGKEGAFSRPVLATLLLMLDKYDVINEHVADIITVYNSESEKERQEVELFIFTIKLCIWLKLSEGKVYEALRPLELFIQRVKLLQSTGEKEKEVSDLILSLFKLQIHTKVAAGSIREVLNAIRAGGVPFNEVFIKVWTCISEPESVDAQKYLYEKAIGEIVTSLKETAKPTASGCGELQTEA